MALGLNMVDDSAPGIETVNRTQSATRREAELITNVVDQPTTWGSGIPNTAGRVRVQGAQIWVSAFVRTADVYDVQESKTVLYPGYFRRIDSDTVQYRLDQTVEYPTINETVVANATTQYSMAFSFGYNIAPQYARKLSKLWINGLLVYDFVANLGTDKYQFEFFPNGGQSKTMVETLGAEDAPYFPNQTYIVIKGLKLEDTNNVPIQSCSAEFTIEGVAGGTLTYTDAAGWPQGGVYAGSYYDYDKRIVYTYINPYLTYTYGRVVQWDLDTGALLNVVDVKMLTTKGTAQPMHDPIPSRGVAWFPKAQTIAYSGASAQNNSSFYTMNLAAGEIRANVDIDGVWIFSNTSGGMTLDNTEGAGSGFLWLGANGNAFYAVTVGDYGRTLSVNYVSTGSVPIQQGFAASDARGFAVSAVGKDLYRLTLGGVSKLRTLATAPERIGAYGGHLFLFNANQINRQSYGGQNIYTIVNNNLDLRPGNQNAFENSDLSGGTFGWQYDSGSALVLNLASGSVQRYSGSTDTFRAWDSQRGQGVGAPRTGNPRSFTYQPSLGVGGSMKLRDIIRGLYRFAGQDANRLIFNGIDDDVPGAFIFGQQPLTDIIKNLQSLFRINRIDSETSTTFYRNRPITGTVEPDATIDAAQLIYLVDQDDDRTRLKGNRASIASLPDVIELAFIDPENDYVVNTLNWTRPDAALNTSNKLEAKVPLVLTKQQALAIVQNNFNDASAAGSALEFRLPVELSMYESGDVLAIESGKFKFVGDGIVSREFVDYVQIIEDTRNADGTVDCKAIAIVTTTPTTFQLPTTPGSSAQTLANLRAASQAIIIDSTALTFFDDPLNDKGYVQYATVIPKIALESWPGGYLARKRIGANEDWRKLFEIARGKSDVIVFRAASVLSGGVFWQTDDTPLKLNPLFGKWDAANNTNAAGLYADFRKNLAFYGRPGAWELVQFQKIENNTVKGIIRGRRGTEVFCGGHALSDYFVIAGNYLFAEQRGLDLRGTEQYKGVALSQTFESVSADDIVTPQGNSAKPWAVRNIKAVRSGSDIVLSWLRRDRIHRNWGRKPDDKLNSESVEQYSIDIIGDDGKVAKTFDNIPSPTFTFTAADGASSAATLTLVVYQVGAHVGRGFGERVTVNVG